MIYGFYKWFKAKKIMNLSRNLVCSENNDFIIIRDKKRCNNELERHIRIDKYGNLANANLPEAHATYRTNTQSIRINKNTNNTNQLEIIETKQDETVTILDQKTTELYSKRLDQELDLLTLYMQEYYADIKNLLNNLTSIDLSLSRLSADIIATQNKEQLLNQYKEEVSIFIDIERELNNFQNENNQLNISSLIQKIYESLLATSTQEQPFTKEQHKKQEPTTQLISEKKQTDTKNIETLKQQESPIILEEKINASNFATAMNVVNNPPKNLSSTEYLSIITKIKEFVLKSSKEELDDNTLEWVTPNAIMQSLETIYDQKKSTQEKVLEMKKWENATCMQQAIQSFCSSSKIQEEGFMVSPIQFLAINNELELFLLFFKLGANVNGIGIYNQNLDISLKYSLLLDLNIKEAFYIVFLMFYKNTIQSHENLRAKLNLAKYNAKKCIFSKETEYINFLTSPLRLAVQRKFYTSVQILMDKNPNITDVMITYASILEHGRIAYAKDCKNTSNYITVSLEQNLLHTLLKQNNNNPYQSRTTKNKIFIESFPKIAMIFHGFNNVELIKAILTIELFINKKKIFNKDRYIEITTLLINSARIKNESISGDGEYNDALHTANDALHTAKASVYVCLYTLQNCKNNIQIEFYEKLGILMYKAVHLLTSIIQNIDRKTLNFNFWIKFLIKLKNYNQFLQKRLHPRPPNSLQIIQPIDAKSLKTENKALTFTAQKKKRKKKRKNHSKTQR